MEARGGSTARFHKAQEGGVEWLSETFLLAGEVGSHRSEQNG